MNKHAIGVRAEQIFAELSDKNLSPQRVQQLSAELDQLETASRNYGKALNLAGAADPYPNGDPGDAAGWGLPKLKTFGAPNAPRVAPQSPLQLDAQQTHALWQAARNKTPYRVEIGSKGLEHGGFMGDVRMKTPLAESGLNNQLPAIQIPGQRGNYGLPYEPFRVMSALPTVAMTGPGAAYLQHTGNTHEASGVAEGATKPSLGPVVTETFIKPQKIAGTIEATLEILQDHEEFAAFLPTELARSMYNQESLYLLQAGLEGGPSGAAFTGLLATSGILTREVGSDTPLDALNKAFVDLRTGTVFCEPDLVIVHPETLGALRREKDSMGRYILAADRGPGEIDQSGEEERIWGVRTVQTTQMPAGQALVMSIQQGAAVGWIRMGMMVEFNPYGGTVDGTELWSTNTYSWRADTRISLSVPRPAANNLVTGLPTS